MISTDTTTAQVRVSHHSTPLMRLLWKEFSERRWWAICWALTILAISLYMHGQRFCGDTGRAEWPWGYVSLVLAGMVGLGGYTGEMKRGRAFFLFTRPVRWHEVLLAKVFFGTFIMVGVPLLAAGIFRLTSPEPYHRLMTLPNVLDGIGEYVWPMALCYLCGLACSTILPGLAGGALTAVSVGTGVLLMLGFGMLLWWMGDSLKLVDSTTFKIGVIASDVRDGILFFALIGIFWGGMMAARSGLYHHYTRRITLFTPKFFLSMLIGGVVGLCIALCIPLRVFLYWYPTGAASISPHGSYAIVPYQQHYSISGGLSDIGLDSRTEFIRLADNTMVRRITSEKQDDAIRCHDWYWLTDTMAVGSGNGNTSKEKLLYHANTNTIIPVATGHIGTIGTPSPNGRLAVAMIVKRETPQQPYVRHLYFCNLIDGHTKDVFLPLGNHDARYTVWWESNDTVAYYIAQGFYGIPPTKRRKIPAFHEEVRRIRVPEF